MRAETPHGLDLEEHYSTVQKVVRSEYGGAPIENDDLVHRVCEKILRQNRRAAGYDPDRASVPHYVRMVARSVVSDYVGKSSVQNEYLVEPLETDSMETRRPDVELRRRGVDPQAFMGYLKKTLEWEDTEPRRVYLLTRLGYRRSEIADIIGEDPRTVSWYRRRLKQLIDAYVSQRQRESR